jgi:hypothetical protein
MKLASDVLKSVLLGFGLGLCALMLYLNGAPSWIVTTFVALAIFLTAVNVLLSYIGYRKYGSPIGRKTLEDSSMDFYALRRISAVVLFDTENLHEIQQLVESSYHLAMELLKIYDPNLDLRRVKSDREFYSKKLEGKFRVLAVTRWSLDNVTEQEWSELDAYGVVPSSLLAIRSGSVDAMTTKERHQDLKGFAKTVSRFMKENAIDFQLVAVPPGNMITPTKMSLLGNALFWIWGDAVLLYDRPLSATSARNIINAVHQFPFTSYCLLVPKREWLRGKSAHFAIITSNEAYMSEGLLDFGRSMLETANHLEELITGLEANAKQRGWRIREIIV